MRSGARYGEAIFMELRSAIPADASEILDLGAGAGFFLEKFHTIGIAVDAVANRDEVMLTPHSAARSRRRRGCTPALYRHLVGN
jgi:hypothetical protein